MFVDGEESITTVVCWCYTPARQCSQSVRVTTDNFLKLRGCEPWQTDNSNNQPGPLHSTPLTPSWRGLLVLGGSKNERRENLQLLDTLEAAVGPRIAPVK